MPYLAVKCPLDIEKTRAAAVAITSITNANPAVVSKVAHGLDNGDIIVLVGIQGMTELDGQVARVANKTADDFELEDIDTTDFGAFSAGSFQEITAWERIGTASGINAPDAQPDRQDVTKLADGRKKYLFGLDDSPLLSVNGLLEKSDAGVAIVRAAAKSKAPKALRWNLAPDYKMFVNAYCAGGSGFGAEVGGKVTQGMSFSQIGEMMWYEFTV